MKIAYLDLFSGVSGDMLLGALLDCGLPFRRLEELLNQLPVDGFSLECRQVTRQGISAAKVDVTGVSDDEHRHLDDIFAIIEEGGFAEEIEKKAKRTFRLLAEVEAEMHDTSPDKIHFHEIGAVDAIVDIVGTVAGFHELGIETITASRMQIGTGFVSCAHGCLPVPAPATAALLAGIPVFSRGIEAELVTPTGAAMVNILADDFGPCPSMAIAQVGYGAGSRELDEQPNLLRIIVGESQSKKKAD